MSSSPVKRKFTVVEPGSHATGRENPTKVSSTTLKEFESVWPRIVGDLEKHSKQYKLPKQSLDWFVQVHI
jgi:hypothetical protein